VVIPCRAVALLTVDEAASTGRRIRNDRVIARPTAARRDSDLMVESMLSARVRPELIEFFRASTALEGKDLKILGWEDAAAALTFIRGARTGADSFEQERTGDTARPSQTAEGERVRGRALAEPRTLFVLLIRSQALAPSCGRDRSAV
jgi:hypothetical protein